MNSSLSKKKILYVITKSNFGGAQRYVFDLAKAMQKKDYEVVVALGGHGELAKKLEKIGIKVFYIDNLQRDISLLKEIKSLISLFKIINKFKPDIIHLNSAKAGGLGSVAARILRVKKIIFTAHGWSFLEPRKWWWKTMVWLSSYITSLLVHHIITVSHFDSLQTKYMFGIKNKLSVIHPAAEEFSLLSREEARTKLFSKEIINVHGSNIWLVTVAELNHNKNQTTAIDAVAEFNNNNKNKIFYTIIGGGEMLSELKEQVDLRGLNDYVYFSDYLKDARSYLWAFDIFLLPSKKEGLPYAILEAGLAELPCLASNVGGIPEVIIDRETGLLTDPNNHTTIVEALDFVFRNADKRVKYSNNLYKHIKENFSLLEMIEKTEKVYLSKD
ncbi:MAG: glycosyltransferase family 4 protein [Candidatus Paceibacterota bacterium]